MTSTVIERDSMNRRGYSGGRLPAQGQILDGLVGEFGTAAARTPPLAEVTGFAAARRSSRSAGRAGDPEGGYAVADELDDVVRAPEQDIEVLVFWTRVGERPRSCSSNTRCLASYKTEVSFNHVPCSRCTVGGSLIVRRR